MVLVTYSDSENSADEKTQAPAKKDTPASATRPDTKFTVDKFNPRKIRVNLQEVNDEGATNEGDGEPTRKRPRIGGGYSGFNSMLPAPKRDTQSANGVKPASSGAPRKVFSLKTGAEPGFSRESDAELKQLFAEQSTDPVEDGLGDTTGPGRDNTGTIGGLSLPPVSQPAPPKQGNAMMFKPLSVARNTHTKKKPPAKHSGTAPGSRGQTKAPNIAPESSIPAPKVNLFSIGNKDEPPDTPGAQQVEYEPLVYQRTAEEDDPTAMASDGTGNTPPLNDPALSTASEPLQQSLDSIASDLNLSASAKRQLLGRNHKNASKISSSIINFNTDQEYAANEVLRASGEQVQHNSVRAIAPGKHSLKQLVNAASGQKEALEESFASGRRNKKEAGGRYGW
jgi:Mitotic checkpoint regulator, MAD2B-interacting